MSENTYNAKHASTNSKKIERLVEDNPGASNKELSALFKKKYPKLWNSRANRWIGLWRSQQDVEYDSTTDDSYDERSVGIPKRDAKGTITHYHYKILRREKDPLTGDFTRDQMQSVYELYSNNEGAGLNQRTVSREFKFLTFSDFKRVLRAFNITKDSIPIAPHILEESSIEEAQSYIRHNKESQLLKNLDETRSKYYEAKWKEARAELLSKEKLPEELLERFQDYLGKTDFPVFKVKLNKKATFRKPDLFVYISDQHVGAANSNRALYENKYDKGVFNARMQNVAQAIKDMTSSVGSFGTVFILNLGDNLDGLDGKTTRGRGGHSNHTLLQNLTNREQFDVYTETMIEFFKTLHTVDVCEEISYHTVSDDNHSGDFGYFSNRLLEEGCKRLFPNMSFKIYDKMIGYFKHKGHTWVLGHGKDEHHMKFGWPLTLNEKVENYINQYLDSRNLGSRNIHVVTGDLHQTATTHGKRFDYKKVSSLYGASEWMMHNFGITSAGVDMDVLIGDSLYSTHRVFRNDSLESM